MKGIMMFDNLNDIVYFDADDDLFLHIENLAMKDGLLQDSSLKDNKGDINKNVVMQLFSPLIASYKVMQVQMGNTYKYIETENGIILVFNEILNYIVIGVNSKEQNLQEAQQELYLFLMITELLWGPCFFINDSYTCLDVSRSQLTSSILSKWKALKTEQQMYLVEAVERLIINQDITAMCINLLQEVLQKMRNSFKCGTISHAFALVDCKLLALYSSRNSGHLRKDILLLLTVIALVLKRSENNEDNEKCHSDDEFFVPVSQAQKSSKQHEMSHQNRNSKKNKPNKDVANVVEPRSAAQSLLIYLPSHNGPVVPHILYVIEVTSKISIVVLCELTTFGTVSSLSSSVIRTLQNLQCHPTTFKPLESFEAFETNFRSLLDAVWKMKSVDKKEIHMKVLITKWENLKRCGIEAAYQKTNDKSGNPKLDSAISSLCDSLKLLFEEAIALPCLAHEQYTWQPPHQDVLIPIRKLCQRRLSDVADFLEVKAMQNITMSSYIPEYPGLVHFIYVDRSSDSLIAPAVVLKKGHLNGATSLKQKVWKMVPFGRRHLDGANKFCCLWKENDLYFFYTIWFENSTGKMIKPTSYPALKNFPFKGILCGNFFRKLVRECFPEASYDHIFCYELFTIHLDSTPVQVIGEHCCRLRVQLWDFTGAYRTSLDLL